MCIGPDFGGPSRPAAAEPSAARRQPAGCRRRRRPLPYPGFPIAHRLPRSTAGRRRRLQIERDWSAGRVPGIPVRVSADRHTPSGSASSRCRSSCRTSSRRPNPARTAWHPRRHRRLTRTSPCSVRAAGPAARRGARSGGRRFVGRRARTRGPGPRLRHGRRTARPRRRRRADRARRRNAVPASVSRPRSNRFCTARRPLPTEMAPRAARGRPSSRWPRAPSAALGPGELRSPAWPIPRRPVRSCRPSTPGKAAGWSAGPRPATACAIGSIGGACSIGVRSRRP